MTKNSGMRTVFLMLLLVVFFSVSAHASPFENMRLVLEDLNGISGDSFDGGTVINLNPLTGQIAVVNWNVGSFVVTTTVAASIPEDSSGATTLTLTSHVVYSGKAGAEDPAGFGRIRITLMDSGYGPPLTPTVNYTGALSGWTGIPNGGSATFQTWMNANNELPTDPAALGGDLGGGPWALPASGNTLVELVANGEQTVTNIPLTSVGNQYSIFSQATIQLEDLGDQTDFTLTGKVEPFNDSGPLVSVPEPTSLMLLGSGLAGLALFRRKKG